MYQYVPSIKNINLTSIKEAVTTQMISAKNELYSVSDPPELKADKDLDLKYLENENNLTILSNTTTSLKRQKELSHEQAEIFSCIGSIFHRIANIETIGEQPQQHFKIVPDFISDRDDGQALDADEEALPQPSQQDSNNEFNHLDIPSESRIQKLYQEYA